MALDGNTLQGWTAQELEQALGRVRHGQDVEARKPRFDSVLHKDVVDAALHGRKIDSYVQALERAGFKFFAPHALPLFSDGRARWEGEWRHKGLRMSMTSNEVCAWFSSPEEFWKWAQQQKIKLLVSLGAHKIR